MRHLNCRCYLLIDDVEIECEITAITWRMDEQGNESVRYSCDETNTTERLRWNIELPPIEYTPQLFDKITLKQRYDAADGGWHVYFRFKSAPWLEVVRVW